MAERGDMSRKGDGAVGEETPSDVPDVLARGLRVVFCGINPGRVSAAAQAHFANPRNDFWRLLHAAGFTSRLYEPHEQFSLLDEGIGVTNAAYRTTPGSGDLRRADFAGSAERLERIARELGPAWLGFVGKEAYRGAFGERVALGRQRRTLVDTGLFVLPSTSPANAAVPWEERLHWFRALRGELDKEPTERRAVRALVLDGVGRTFLMRWRRPHGSTFWVVPGGGLEEGETELEALRRELREELGLVDPRIGPLLWRREFVFPWGGGALRQRESFHLVHAEPAELAVPQYLDAQPADTRWWTVDEVGASDELFAPRRLATLLRDLLLNGPPSEALDVGV
ncbi:MAG TPA: NUDIX domain-containing protein [Gaiellaceae bacterium]|nr:NUDIX domain-containing protein [Gaiellaceae bacterium]